MKKIFLTLEKHIAKYVILILGKTLGFIELTKDPEEHCIYLFWHRNIIPLMYYFRNRSIVILISPSNDGELIAGPATQLGYQTVRGSSSKNSIGSLKKLLKLSKDNSIAITPDGPLGPRETVKDSVIYLAVKTKLPLVIVTSDIKKEWIFHTWDLFRVPKPFSKITITYSEPMYISDLHDMYNKRLTIQRLMDRLTSKNRESKY